MITFNKEPSSKPLPDNFTDKNSAPRGTIEHASFDKSCREIRRSRLLSSDQAYTAEDVAFLNGG